MGGRKGDCVQTGGKGALKNLYLLLIIDLANFAAILTGAHLVWGSNGQSCPTAGTEKSRMELEMEQRLLPRSWGRRALESRGERSWHARAQGSMVNKVLSTHIIPGWHGEAFTGSVGTITTVHGKAQRG